MSRLRPYRLKDYITAVDIIRQQRHFGAFKHEEGSKGSAYRFMLYRLESDREPIRFWNIHYSYDKKRTVSSKEDLRKAAHNLGIGPEDFMKVLESL